jgi:hypothetical protein
MTIEITDNGKVRTYHLKEPGTLTVADYRILKAEPLDDTTDERERLVEMVKRLTGIPKTHLRRIPLGTFGTMLDTMAEHVEQLGKDIAASEAADPSTTFDFDGTTYTVPQNLEAETSYGQWEDLHNVLLPQAGTNEADIIKAVCAGLCMPEGEEYNGAHVRANLEAFEDLPIATALAVCAFFFASSKRFRNDISRSILHSLTLKLPKEGPVPNATANATVPTQDLSEQPS